MKIKRLAQILLGSLILSGFFSGAVLAHPGNYETLTELSLHVQNHIARLESLLKNDSLPETVQQELQEISRHAVEWYNAIEDGTLSYGSAADFEGVQALASRLIKSINSTSSPDTAQALSAVNKFVTALEIAS